MANLPTNLKDDILDASVNQRRRYRIFENTDGTVELEDVTVYSQVGSEYGAGLINETNKQVNEKLDSAKIVRDLKTISAMTKEGFVPDALALKDVNDSLTADNAQPFKFGYDSATGKYGYWVKEADTDVFVPFNGGLDIDSLSFSVVNKGNSFTATVGKTYIIFGLATKTNKSVTASLNGATIIKSSDIAKTGSGGTYGSGVCMVATATSETISFTGGNGTSSALIYFELD